MLKHSTTEKHKENTKFHKETAQADEYELQFISLTI
jgi:hypothetical protein